MVKQLEGQKQWDGHVLGEHVDMCHQVMGRDNITTPKRPAPPPPDNVWAEGSWSSAHRGRCEKVSILQPFAIHQLDRQGNGLIAWRAKNIVAMAGKVYKSKKRIKFTVSRRKSMAFYHVWYCCRPKQETDCTRPHWRGAAWRNVEIMKWQNAGGFTCSLRGAFQNGMRAGASSG